MNKKIFSLAFTLDQGGYIDLIQNASLYQLDQEISRKYHDSKEVIKDFDQDIGELCLSKRRFIQDENKRNHRNWTGSIVILEKNYQDDRLENIRKIKVLYQGDKLPSRRTCVRLIKEKLQNDVKLKELYNRKEYLLSPNEIELISLYLKYKNIKYKNSAIGFFGRRILEEDSSKAYYDRRMLANLCDLVISKGEKVKNLKVKNTPKIEEGCAIAKDPLSIEVEQMSIDKLLKKEGKSNV